LEPHLPDALSRARGVGFERRKPRAIKVFGKGVRGKNLSSERFSPGKLFAALFKGLPGSLVSLHGDLYKAVLQSVPDAGRGRRAVSLYPLWIGSGSGTECGRTYFESSPVKLIFFERI
jgi:hypothetical protein